MPRKTNGALYICGNDSFDIVLPEPQPYPVWEEMIDSDPNGVTHTAGTDDMTNWPPHIRR